MKRFMLLTMFFLLAIGLQAQTYHPFVERGKLWKVHGFNLGSAHTVTDYYFTEDESFTLHDGREYVQMYYHKDNDDRVLVGEFREEGQRVYQYDAERQTEHILFDFSLKVGDTFHETRHDLSFIVERTGQQVVNGDTLKTLHLSTSDGMDTADWVECIGSTRGPLKNFVADEPVWGYYVAYVSGSRYWPFTFGVNWNGWWGAQLKTLGHTQDTDSLTYELVNDPTTDVCSLHVFGVQRLTCGTNHYINCIAKPTADLMVKKLTFQIEDVEPLSDCEGTYYVNYSFPFFNKYTTYIVTDERGEHIVPVRELAPYRPFIEDGKVWKVGWFPGITNWARKLDYYYFDGDSVIGGQLCTRMFCHTERAKEWVSEGDPLITTEYRGAFYEDGKRVYCFFPGRDVPELMYDFESEVGDTIDIHGGSCIIANRDVIQQAFFKGNSTSVAYYQKLWENHDQDYGYDFQHTILWAEGIGRFDSPFENVCNYGDVGYYNMLMQCSLGDEIIYKNPNQNLQDGVTPDEDHYTDGDVKKQWLDFTHTTKPRPKAPRRGARSTSGRFDTSKNEDENADAVTLSGEYSDTKLYVSLSPLQGPYTVTITDADNNSVYTHTVHTSRVVAINTDLSQFADGTYTVTVENDEEIYTAQLVKGLDVAVRDIPAANCESANCKLYDLIGRRLSRRPSQGVYIENGRLRVATNGTSK